MKKIVMMVVVSLFLVGTGSMAQAFTLTPNFAPDYGSSGIVAQTGALNYYTSNAILAGTLSQTVYLNTTGLLFVYNLNRTGFTASGADVTSLNTSNFAGFTTVAGTVGYAGVQNLPLVNAPDNYSRTASTITFNWDVDETFVGALTQGQTSPTLFIQTNAKYLTKGSMALIGTGSVQDSQSQSFPNAFAPTATPEPATVSLLGMGLLGLMGFRRKMTV